MPRPVNFNDRAFITGKTQSGKTTFAGYLFAGMTGARRFVVDPKGRLRFPGVEPVTNGPAALRRAAEPVVHVIPRPLTRDVFEGIYEAAWQLGGPMVVWTDEAMAVTKRGWAPQYFDLIQQQGADLPAPIGHLVCSQRPVDVASTARTEADHIFIFVPVPHRLNLDALTPELGDVTNDELARRMRELHAQEGDHSFLWYSRDDDELVDCAPIPA